MRRSSKGAIPHSFLFEHVRFGNFTEHNDRVGSVGFPKRGSVRKQNLEWGGIRLRRSILFCTVFCLLLSLLTACTSSVPSDPLEIRFLDVGQGDCILLRTEEGDVLIDAGPESEQETLLAHLRMLGVEALELMVITHPDEDHMGGADGILRSFPVKEVWTNGYEDTHETATAFRSALEESAAVLTAVSAGQKYVLGAMTLFVYAPFSTAQAEAGNDGSIVLRCTCGNVHAMFMGDAEVSTEEALLSKYGPTNLQCDLLKVGHHGSSTSTGERFLTALSPTYAVISCGSGNSFGHPHGEVLWRLQSVRAEILRTDLDGDICFVTDGETLVHVS